MVKGISSINGLVKTCVISALLAGTTVLYASNPIKKGAQPNQTEIDSEAGTEALNATSLQGVQQTFVPSVNNPRLDATFRKFAKNDNEKKEINDIINSIYKEEGTFLASVYIQHEIDRQQLGALLDENTDLLSKINPELAKKVREIGSKFYKSVRPIKENVEDKIEKSYTPEIFSLLAFDHIPNAKEVIKRLDSIADKRFISFVI